MPPGTIKLLAACIFSSLLITSFGADIGRRELRGHVPAAVPRLTAKGRLMPTDHISLAIALPLRNPAALDEFIRQLYDPASTNFHKFICPPEFAARFGPTDQDYQAVKDFARTNGLLLIATYGNRLVLDVGGPAAAVEKAFGLTLKTYRHPVEPRDFFAPDTDPSVDSNLPISHITGFDNFLIPRPASRSIKLSDRPAGVMPSSGSGLSGLYIGKDFRVAYAPGVVLNGAGQTVAMFELDGYHPGDIASYESMASLPAVALTNILVDGYSGAVGANNLEVALDIDMAIAMATNLTQLIVYEAQNNGSTPVDLLNRIASDNLARQISSSWLIGDNPSFDTAYKQMAAQGQTFFQASGDNGAFYPGIPQSTDDTNITLVGGTTLTMNGAGGSYAAEKVWNWYSTGQGAAGSGGGVSLNSIPIPSWQTNIDMTTNQGSTTIRNIPDVALTADGILVVADNGTNYFVGGTSAAAPLWAGYMALINQQAAVLNVPPAGYLNPAIYAIAKSTNYPATFHDITSGNNTNTTLGTKYFAAPGYDLCTGWGTPNGQNFINTLTPPDILLIVPPNGLNFAGLTGGPFVPSSLNYVLTNSSASPYAWSLAITSAWLTASLTNGTLAAGGATNIAISLSPAAANLGLGAYTAKVQFTNGNTLAVQTLPFTLSIGPAGVQNGGFETGDFTSWNLNGTMDGNANFIANSSSIPGISPHSGSFYAALGEAGAQAFLTQTCPTTPGQLYLLSAWVNSSANPFTGHQTTPNEITILWNGSLLLDKLNLAPLGWTNVQFIVQAIASATTLQFRGRDDPYYLGLDDVTLTPGFAPSITASPLPANQTVLSGINVTYSAAVSGSTNLVFQWRKNGTNLSNGAGISGVTTTNLLLTGVTTNSIGNYSLFVTNIFGSVTSSVVALTVVLPAGIASSSLSNRTLECGGNISYTLAASGTAPLFIQWSLDGLPVSNATNTSLTLTNVHLPSHAVAVMVTNFYGTFTSNATLTVNDTLPPIITINGNNPFTNELGSAFSDPGATAADACAGAVPVTTNGVVNAAVVGTNTLTYMAGDGNGNTDAVTRTVIVRDTTPPSISWSFTNLVVVADTNCVALMTNVTGTNFIIATDLSVSLTITQNPTNNAALLPGTNVIVITVADVSGNKSFSTNRIVVLDQTPPTIVLNGGNLLTNELGSAFTNPGAFAADTCAGNVSLVTNGVVNVNVAGTNTLTYFATDAAGNTSSAIHIVIVRDTTPPSIIRGFTNLVVSLDTNCLALMPDVTGTNFILATDLSSPLVISQSPTNQSILSLGTNIVIIAVADPYGNTAFSTNQLVVRDTALPLITSQPQSRTNFAGTTSNFSIAATACTPLTFQWLFNNAALTARTNSTLTLSNVVAANAGNYSATVTSAGGATTSAVAVLTVNLLASSLALVSSANPDGFKANLIFTAAVTPTNAAGSIQFFTNGTAFDVELLVAGSAASTNLNTLPRGTNLVAAIYSGGGIFQPVTNSLAQVVTNHPPVVSPASYSLTAGLTLNISVTNLATYWSDTDGDALSISYISPSTNGVIVTNTTPWLFYSNTNYVKDLFLCTISDGFGGTNVQAVSIVIMPQTNTTPYIAGVTFQPSGLTLILNGGYGSTYILQSTTNLVSGAWQPLATNALDVTGVWRFTDGQVTNFPNRFYRLKLGP